MDKPYLVRYFTWVWDCLHGNFGISYVNPSRTVAGELLRCMPATLQLAGASLIMVILLSLPIGFLCAVYKDGWFDRLMRGLVFMTTAMPPYWVGLLLMWLISIKLDLLPTSGNGTIRHLILPAFTVSLSYISTYIRLIRNNMLENMKQDYVLYANVRGLTQKSILVKHILKNSMHTCIVAIGMSIPQLISGTIVVENVFAWPGLGTLCISSIFNRDYPVIQTYVLLIGVLFVMFNLLFDILQTVSDPRMRKEEQLMLHRFLHNKTAVSTVTLVLIVALMGIFAPFIAPHDPYATNILNKFSQFSKEYPLELIIWAAASSPECCTGSRSDPWSGSAYYARNHRSWRSDGTSGWVFPGNYRRTDHADSRCNAIFSKPDHGICSGCTAGH
ncbi:MAG: ABC transporter permease subunit [Enterocloster sp.]